MLLIATLLDAQPTIGIAFRDVVDIERACDVDARIVLADPGIDVLDIKGDGFAQARDRFL